MLTKNKAKNVSRWGGGGERRQNRAQPLFLRPKVALGDIQDQSWRPCRGHAGALGTARHKADGWLTDKAAGSRRVSRGTWVRSHKDRTSKGSPKSRPDHTSATINNVCSKVGGIERGPYWRRPAWPSSVKQNLVLCYTKETLFTNALPIYIIRAASGYYISLRWLEIPKFLYTSIFLHLYIHTHT